MFLRARVGPQLSAAIARDGGADVWSPLNDVGAQCRSDAQGHLIRRSRRQVHLRRTLRRKVHVGGTTTGDTVRISARNRRGWRAEMQLLTLPCIPVLPHVTALLRHCLHTAIDTAAVDASNAARLHRQVKPALNAQRKAEIDVDLSTRSKLSDVRVIGDP